MPKFSLLSVLFMVSMPGIIVIRVALNSEVQVAAAAAVVCCGHRHLHGRCRHCYYYYYY